jgi:hypothetical protein
MYYFFLEVKIFFDKIKKPFKVNFESLINLTVDGHQQLCW